MSDQFVYIILSEEIHAIKVGLAKDPLRRMGNLQVGCPYTLRLLAYGPGDRKMEKDLHHRLRYSHMRGEWFELDRNARDVLFEFFGWELTTPQQRESARKAEECRRQLEEYRERNRT